MVIAKNSLRYIFLAVIWPTFHAILLHHHMNYKVFLVRILVTQYLIVNTNVLEHVTLVIMVDYMFVVNKNVDVH